jgi:hypothetical protein
MPFVVVRTVGPPTAIALPPSAPTPSLIGVVAGVVIVTGAVVVGADVLVGVVVGVEVITDVVVVNVVVVVDVGAFVVVVVATGFVVVDVVVAGIVVFTVAVVVVLVEVGTDDVVHVFWVSGIHGIRTYPEVEGDTRLRSLVMELMWAAFMVAAWGSIVPYSHSKTALLFATKSVSPGLHSSY